MNSSTSSAAVSTLIADLPISESPPHASAISMATRSSSVITPPLTPAGKEHGRTCPPNSSAEQGLSNQPSWSDLSGWKTLEPLRFEGSYHYRGDKRWGYNTYGDGSCGRVYEAMYSPPMGSSRQARIVAVKAPSAGASKSILATLEHEARILTYLHRLCNSKDYIVPFLGLDPESSSLVLASLPLTLSSFSETCGQQIRESYTTRKMYEPAVGTAQWLQLASHLIAGLQFLHSRLVIHGDIKPANILLRPSTGTDGTLYDPIYCDFSSAAVPDSPTPDLAITQAYTAPELLKAFMTPSTTPVPTAASDVFALGATLLMPAVGEELYASQPRPRKLAMAMEGRPLEMQASTSQGSRIMPGTIVARVLREAVAAKVDHRCSVGRWLDIFLEEAKDWTKK